MNEILLMVSFLPAGFGLYLLGDFLYWRIGGHVVRAEITGFDQRKSLGLRLPVVSFEIKKGEKQTSRAERIDRFSYVLNRPGEGEPVMVIYLKSAPGRVRIYGMISVIAAGFLFLPLLTMAAIKLGSPELMAQVSYIGMFGVIIIGGWAFLKLIGRNY